MTSTPASARDHADAVVTALDAALTTYDGEGPADPHNRVPYAVVRTDAGDLSGTLGDRHRDLTVTVWVTAVGGTREQAQWAADKVRATLLTTGPTVSGRTVQPLWQVTSQPVTVDADVEPSLFYAVAAYRMHTTS